MPTALATLAAVITSCAAQPPALPPVPAGATTIAEIPARTQPLPGLATPADVVVDRYGWSHMFASTLRDAAAAEGFAMARDRMMQMELFRRTSSGTLAEIFGAVSTRFLQSDVTMRTIGLRRAAQAMWDRLPPGRTHDLFEGFAAGVTMYIRSIRSGAVRPPPGSELLLTASTPDWTPVDSLTVLRLMELFLSFNADAEINRTLVRTRARTVFDEADPARSPEYAARRGFFSDVVRFGPPSSTTIVPDYYALGPHARRLQHRDATGDGAWRLAALEEPLAALRRVLPPTNRLAVGTNAWAVDAAHSANGHALLANDPHLPLVAPSIVWGVHLVVTGGADAMDVTGTAFPGVPGVVFGHNVNVAWGITNGMFDQMDVYDETITPGASGQPDTVAFEGGQSPIVTRVEHIPNGYFGTRDVVVEVVPHHGPILPTFTADAEPIRRTATHALSVRWVAAEPTHEIEALTALLYAADVDGAERAVIPAEVPSLGFVFADTHGTIAYRATGLVPIRAPGALTFDPITQPDGTLPAAVLPGTGEAEWVGFIDPATLPHRHGAPWVAAANNDPAGLSRTGNPFAAQPYLGYDWSPGFRAERIEQRLAMLGSTATREDMASIQSDHVLLAAQRFAPFLLAALARLTDAWDHPAADSELATVSQELAPHAAMFRDVASRLAAWSFDAPSGDESPAAARDAVAAAIFHAWLARILDLALSDEIAALQDPTPGATALAFTPEQRMVALLFLLEHPDRARTLDATTGQSAIWDDLRTPQRETRDVILLRALAAATTDLAALTHRDDLDGWRWGSLHTVRFTSLIPHFSLSLGIDLSIPPPGDPNDPNGFARPGGIDSVDQGWPALEDSNGALAPVFSYTQGPARRLTVEMAPDGPQAFDALPGGESGDVHSVHFRDEAVYWRSNTRHPLPRTEAEVASSAEARIRLVPAM